MTWKQKHTFAGWIDDHAEITELHHGDCIGADEEAHQLTALYTVIHPPENPAMRAWCTGDETRHPRPYKDRNYDIVDDTDVLIATPSHPNEILQSGTWQTIRHARKTGKPVVVINPDGSITHIHPDETTTQEPPCTPDNEPTPPNSNSTS